MPLYATNRCGNRPPPHSFPHFSSMHFQLSVSTHLGTLPSWEENPIIFYETENPNLIEIEKIFGGKYSLKKERIRCRHRASFQAWLGHWLGGQRLEVWHARSRLLERMSGGRDRGCLRGWVLEYLYKYLIVEERADGGTYKSASHVWRGARRRAWLFFSVGPTYNDA
jgi:hypothetical protein